MVKLTGWFCANERALPESDQRVPLGCVLSKVLSEVCYTYLFWMMIMISSLAGLPTMGIFKLKDAGSLISKMNSYFHNLSDPKNSMTMTSLFQIQIE